MEILVSLLAAACLVAAFYRVVTILDRMNPRARGCTYMRYVGYGLSQAGLLLLTFGGAVTIWQGRADLWIYLLVFSVGAGAFFDRRRG